MRYLSTLERVTETSKEMPSKDGDLEIGLNVGSDVGLAIGSGFGAAAFASASS